MDAKAKLAEKGMKRLSKLPNGVWFALAVVALLWAAWSNVPKLAMFFVVDHIAHYTGYPWAWLTVLVIVYGVGLLLLLWQRRKARQ